MDGCDKQLTPVWPGTGRLGGVRRQDVYAILKQHALQFRFRPGQHLAIVELSDQLRVSNTPIREALIRLHAEGLIAAVPARGFFAKELRQRDMVELHDFAWLLLRYSVRVAAWQPRTTSFTPPPPQFNGDGTMPPAALLACRTEALFVDLARRSGNEAMRFSVADICERTRHIRRCAFESQDCAPALRASLASLTKGIEDRDADAVIAALAAHFEAVRAALPNLVVRAIAASFEGDNAVAPRCGP